MAEYRRNLRGILAKNGLAQSTQICWPERPGPAKLVKPEIYNPDSYMILQEGDQRNLKVDKLRNKF